MTPEERFWNRRRLAQTLTAIAALWAVVAALTAAGGRAEADIRNEKINYKVREHSVGKVPVILAIGMKEVEDRTVSVRRLGETQTAMMSLADAVAEFGRLALPPDLT